VARGSNTWISHNSNRGKRRYSINVVSKSRNAKALQMKQLKQSFCAQ
jgi:ribosomal protein L28